MRPTDKSVIQSWARKEYLNALLQAWELDGLRYNAIRQPDLKLTLRNIVFEACHFVVTELGGRRGERKEAQAHLDHLLSRPVPSCLLEHDPFELDEPWCQNYRKRMVLAHLLCARAVIGGTPESALKTINTDLDRLGSGTLPLAFLDDLCNQLSTGRRSGMRQPPEVWFPLVSYEGNRESALIARFVMEPVEGKGEVFIAPEQAFVPLDPDFEQVLHHAPQVLKQEGICSPSTSVRVRVETIVDRSLIETPLKGNSCGGALALGLWSLWTGEPLKDDLVISFSLTAPDSKAPDGRSHPILFDTTKLNAVVYRAKTDGRTTTFLVADNQGTLGEPREVDIKVTRDVREATATAARPRGTSVPNSTSPTEHLSSSAEAEAAVPPDIQAQLHSAKALTDADKYEAAIPILEKALVAADESGHGPARAKVRLHLAQALYEAREDFSAAERHFRDALSLVPSNDLNLKHSVLHGLGDMQIFAGRLHEAKAIVQSSLEVAKHTCKQDDLAGSLISLSLLEQALGFQTNAMAKLDEAIQLLLQHLLFIPDDQKKDSAHTLAVCYINKARLCREGGDPEAAIALYAKAQEQHRLSGEKLNAGKALLFCGEVHCANAEWAKGHDCFRRALDCFEQAGNPLWGARALENISRLFATHAKWEEALHTILGAVARAEDAQHPREQIHFLCTAAKVLREWKKKAGRDRVARLIHKMAKQIPEERHAEVMPALSGQMREMTASIDKAVLEDEEVRALIRQAKEIAERERLHEPLANCLLDEADKLTPSENADSRKNLIGDAIALLKLELQEAQAPKRRGHLMGRISALYRETSDYTETISWLKKAGDVFEKAGDPFGLANFHGSLAEIARSEGRLDDEIAEYRKVLSLVEGRSFHHLAAGTRINLAAALRYRREFDEAKKLLTEAEAICERHQFKDYIPAIGRNRSDIEKELQAAQAPSRTLPVLLGSLHQLLRYRPEQAVAYLPFWYFTWHTELLSLVRSGPLLSFMVITNDVDRFMSVAARFQHLADHFLMTTSSDYSIRVDPAALPIPPKWRFPATFTFVGVKRKDPHITAEEEGPEDPHEDPLPRYRFVGPATRFPLYTWHQVTSGAKRQGYVSTLSPRNLPPEAIELMIRRPIKELISRRAVWFPTDRFDSEDPFLTDLRISNERGVFAVYFDRFPTSDAVVVCGGGVRMCLPEKSPTGESSSVAGKWRRALLRVAMLPREQARTALLEIPDLFGEPIHDPTKSIQVEIRLFEFNAIDGRRLTQPALLADIGH